MAYTSQSEVTVRAIMSMSSLSIIRSYPREDLPPAIRDDKYLSLLLLVGEWS